MSTQIFFANYLCIPHFTLLWFPQNYFSQTILILHNTVWPHVGFIKWMTRLCCTSLQNRALEIHVLLLCLMWRQFIIPLWHATIFKKDFHFCLLKLLFQYYITIYIFLCYSVLFPVLIHPITHPQTITEGGKLWYSWVGWLASLQQGQ